MSELSIASQQDVLLQVLDDASRHQPAQLNLEEYEALISITKLTQLTTTTAAVKPELATRRN